MGHLKRRISYDVPSRRLGLPGAFLTLHALGPGETVVVIAPSPTLRLITVPAHWSLFGLLQSWLSTHTPSELAPVEPGSLNPISAPRAPPVLAQSTVIGSGGRLVLPVELALKGAGQSRLELAWELAEGVLKLVVPPEGVTRGLPWAPQVLESDVAAQARVASQGPHSPLPPVPDGLVLPGPVVQVPLGKLQGVDPDYIITDYDRDLADEIVTQGFLRPLVLMGPPPYRVIDGRRRLQVARGLRFPSIPALVFGPLSREDQAQLRYLLETTSDRWNVARQLRVLAHLQLNGADLKSLAALLRKTPRTIQRYLRVAQDRRLIASIERGELSLLEAERSLSPRGRSSAGSDEAPP